MQEYLSTPEVWCSCQHGHKMTNMSPEVDEGWLATSGSLSLSMVKTFSSTSAPLIKPALHQITIWIKVL